MKSDQLIEYNMKNIFLEKSWTKCGGEIVCPETYEILLDSLLPSGANKNLGLQAYLQ